MNQDYLESVLLENAVTSTRRELFGLRRELQDIKLAVYWIAACVAGIGLGTMATALWLVRTAQ